MKIFCMIAIALIPLLSGQWSYAFGGQRQLPPENLQKSANVSVRVQCEEGMLLGILPAESFVELNLNINNPSIIDEQYRSYSANLLNLDNRPTDELKKFLSISPSGEVGVRANIDQEFLVIGRISLEEAQMSCVKSTAAAIQQECVENGWKPGEPGFDRCITIGRDSYREGSGVTLSLHFRSDLTLLLERTKPKCTNKWGFLDPATDREYNVYLKLSAGGREMEFFPIRAKELFGSRRDCRAFEDGWK